jgi:hypothetical protein
MCKCSKKNKPDEIETQIQELILELVNLNNYYNKKFNIIVDKMKELKNKDKKIIFYEADLIRHKTPIKLYDVLHHTDKTNIKKFSLRKRGMSEPPSFKTYLSDVSIDKVSFV